jgi:glutathione S-transferase
LHSKSKPPRDLVLYRDNNGWCPFCERTWTLLEQTKTPYTEKLINLRSKPQYYLKLVPTTLVPAIQFDVSVRKDKDIIKELESDTFSNVTKIMKRRNPFARLMGKRRVVIWESVQTMMAIEKFLSPQHPGKIFMADSPTKEKAEKLLSDVTKAGENG